MPAEKSHEHKITGAASIVGSATVLSRILGYVRDAAVAYVFGAGLYADAFFVAFRVANLLRRLVGEGALTSSFIPIFTEEHASRSEDGSRAMVSSVFTLFTLMLLALTVIGIVFSRELVMLMSPGFIKDPEKFSVTVSLTRQMFPYMLFVGLMAIAMGVLNSFRHFTAPAIAPVFFNIAMIFSVFAIAPFLRHPVYSLSIGVLLGGCVQFAIQLPYLKRYGMSPRPLFKFSDPAIKKIFLLMGPSAFGVGVYQLNIFVTLWFASKLTEGSVSYLYYSGRIMELPIGVFSVAVATAVLPSLSEHAVKNEWEGFKGSLSFALRIVNFVTIPATIGLLVLSYPIIDVLFRRGQFGVTAAAATSIALVYYAVGLVPVSACRLLSSVFYSLKDTVTPVWIALVSFFFNVAFCIVLVGPLKHGGLALATSLASFINMFGLFIMLKIKLGKFGGRKILYSALSSGFASLVTGAIIYLLSAQIGYRLVYGVAPAVIKSAYIGMCIIVGFVSYILLARFFKAPELVFLKDFLRRRE